MNVQKIVQMIGTSISMQNTKEMLYPSLTICEGGFSSGRVFADGQFFQSTYHYNNWKYGTNLTEPTYSALTEVFLQLSTNLPNMSTFTLKPEDIDNRDDISVLNIILQIRFRVRHCHLTNSINLNQNMRLQGMKTSLRTWYVDIVQ